MKRKTIQIVTVVFLFLLVGVGLNHDVFVNSLTEKRVVGDQVAGSYLDAYANAFVAGNNYQFSENALGAPDNRFASIFVEYDNGYLTLDMGLHQEIIDETGPDFEIIAKGGKYAVRVGNSTLDLFYSKILDGNGNQSFDLLQANLTSTRYVQIECRSSTSTEIDAIIAMHYNQPDLETNLPQITDLGDFWVWSDQETTQLSWEVFDLNPWNYSILVDDKTVEQGSWTKSPINYTLDLTDKNNSVEIKLILDDLFGNRAEDAVTIEIRSKTSQSTTKSTHTTETSIFPLVSIVSGFLFIYLSQKWKNRKEKGN